MVELLEDLADVKTHATFCRDVLYRVDEQGRNYRVRVKAGRYAWDGVVSKVSMGSIVGWLRSVGAIRVKGSVLEDLLFA